MSAAPRTPRLRRADCSAPGFTRVRRGRGFAYTDLCGQRLEDEQTLARIRALGIPPAWREVWICPDPRGHLQATGVDGAGRKQYLYHQVWRELRDRQKFALMEEFALALPGLRRQVAGDLEASDELSRPRVLACAVRMIDVGQFRIGSEEYAKEDGGIGLATLSPRHVKVGAEVAVFDYPAKSGVQRHYELHDEDCVAVLRELKKRRGASQLLAYRVGRRWTPIRSDDVNDYIKAYAGEGFSAKDFRTWNATVLAAVELAKRVPVPGERPRSTKRVFGAVAREVSAVLGNTPAVARRSYIDPRVFDRYPSVALRRTLDDISRLDETPDRRRRSIELAVLDLLHEDLESSALEVRPELEQLAA